MSELVKCPRCIAHGRFAVHGADPRKTRHLFGRRTIKCLLCDGRYAVPTELAAAYVLRFEVDPDIFQVSALRRELGCE